MTKEKVRLIGRSPQKKIDGKKGKGVTGWLKPNHVTMLIKKKGKEKRNERIEGENEASDNNAVQKVQLEKRSGTKKSERERWGMYPEGLERKG